MKNNNYWINRSNQRMYEYLSDSEKVADEIAKAYRQSEKYIKSETDKIFRNFTSFTGISEPQARLLMKTAIGKTTADKLKSALSGINDEQLRKQMIAEINTPAYQARIKRLEELNKNIVSECNRLYGTELKLSTGLYTDIADKAFNRTVYDIQKGTGLGYSFSQFPKSRIDEILRNNWSGKHYSQRIWGNTQKLAENLKADLLSGMMSGKSNCKIAEDIAKRYNVSIKNAERLVRTETNYIANQAEIESYKESNIEKYRFVATLDSRTSEICQSLDGQEFQVSDAQSGVNLPPMHAHCRSTTISVISDKCLENLQRRAKNPDGTTEKVHADMNYKEWQKSLTNSEKVAYTVTAEESSKDIMQNVPAYSNDLVRDKKTKMHDFISQTGQQREYFREQNYPKQNQRNSLTFAENNGKMETELGKFKSLLKSDKYIDTEYYSALKERFSHASKASKKVFNKYVKSSSVVDSQFYGTAHYTKGSKLEKEGIYMNYQADYNNVRGAGATWFHEHGHMIDTLSGGISYKNKNYIKSLRKDYENLIHIYHTKFPDMNLSKITKNIGDCLTDMREHSAVSDLLHGLSGEMIEGCAFHKMQGGSSYWNDISISREAFAHMFECQSDELRYAKMKEYFPYSLKEFERMLEVM